MFFTKITLTEDLDVRSEFTGVYETILNPTNRLHAELWQRTGQLHPDIHLDRHEEILPTDHGGRLRTSTKWWTSVETLRTPTKPTNAIAASDGLQERPKSHLLDFSKAPND
ncbi:hypothetical protein [Streptosporangium sp. NPDC049046]|uniref:hypothetical protein n=1 Tax=unclassified Streptosporangium TaxID=2632669 RepID=UPI0034393D3C